MFSDWKSITYTVSVLTLVYAPKTALAAHLASYSGVKRSGLEGDQSSLYSAEIKNAFSFTPIRPHIIVTKQKRTL
jgi:hypothetical protein